MKQFLRFETLRQVEVLIQAKALEERTLPIKFLVGIRERAPEVCKDPRMHRRLVERTASADLLPGEAKLIHELVALARD